MSEKCNNNNNFLHIDIEEHYTYISAWRDAQKLVKEVLDSQCIRASESQEDNNKSMLQNSVLLLSYNTLKPYEYRKILPLMYSKYIQSCKPISKSSSSSVLIYRAQGKIHTEESPTDWSIKLSRWFKTEI